LKKYRKSLETSPEKMWPEALPPFIIIASCIAFTGMSIAFLDRWENGGRVRAHKLYSTISV